jgi:hypothetical protein
MVVATSINTNSPFMAPAGGKKGSVKTDFCSQYLSRLKLKDQSEVKFVIIPSRDKL